MSAEDTPEAPNWLAKLEEQRERRLKVKLGHETGAGAPCQTCGDKCPGLDLHFWRKICKLCKCGKEEHDISDDDVYGFVQFTLLGSKPSKAKNIFLSGKQDAITLEWTPKGSNTDVKRYLEELPEDLLPVKGSEAAKIRKQRLQKQMPAHDIDATLCHALSPEEIQQLEEYVAHIRKHSVGQGKIIQLPMIRSQQHQLGGANSQYLHQHTSGQVATVNQVLLQPSNLANSLQSMSLRDKNTINNRAAFLNSQIPNASILNTIDEQSSNYRNEKTQQNFCPKNIHTITDLQNPVSIGKTNDLVYDKYYNQNLAQNPNFSSVNLPSVQDTVNSEKYLSQNPEYAAKLAAQNEYSATLAQNPEYIAKLLQNPEFIKHLSQNVEYAAKLTQNPEFAQKLTHSPDFIQKLTQNPDYTAKLIAQNPIFAQYLAQNPEFVQKLIQNPEYTARLLAQNPNFGQYLAQNPEFIQKLIQNPEYTARLLAQNPEFIQKLIQNPEYTARLLAQNPNFGQFLAQSPEFIQKLIQNPECAAKLLAQNPIFAQYLAQSPEFVQKLIQNPEYTAKLLAHNPIFTQYLAQSPEFIQKLIQNPDYAAKLVAQNPIFAQKLAQNLEFAQKLIQKPELATKLLTHNPEFAQKVAQNPIFAQNPEIAAKMGLPKYLHKPVDSETYLRHPEYAQNFPNIQNVPYQTTDPLNNMGYAASKMGTDPNMDPKTHMPYENVNPLENTEYVPQYLPYNTDVPYNFQTISGQNPDYNYPENLNVPLPLTTSNVERHQEQFQNYDNEEFKNRVPIPVFNAENKLNPLEYEQNISSVGYIRDIDYNIPKIQNSDIENSNIATCHRCKKLFDDGSIAVTVDRTDSLWHGNCFSCHTCNQPLADLLYFYHKESDNIYCGRDYAILKGIPRCAACDELIFVREYCLAEERTFHIKHFCCFECDEPLAGKQYVMENNQPICVHCYEKLKAEKCTDCGYVIGPEEQGVSLQELHWHATDSCFVCKYCRKALLGQKLLLRNKNLFCSDVCSKTYHA